MKRRRSLNDRCRLIASAGSRDQRERLTENVKLQ
jgi:hypothetical protein